MSITPFEAEQNRNETRASQQEARDALLIWAQQKIDDVLSKGDRQISLLYMTTDGWTLPDIADSEFFTTLSGIYRASGWKITQLTSEFGIPCWRFAPREASVSDVEKSAEVPTVVTAEVHSLHTSSDADSAAVGLPTPIEPPVTLFGRLKIGLMKCWKFNGF